jgi:predicted nucleic acid-binding protein
MRAIVDANLYELAFFPHSSQPRQRMLFKELNRRYQLLHNVVALVELLRKRSLKVSVRSEIHRLLAGDDDLLCPELADWKLSAYLLADLAARNPQMNVVARRKMQMDVLIAAIAIRCNLTLISADGDFGLIRQTRTGRNLRLFRPEA